LPLVIAAAALVGLGAVWLAHAVLRGKQPKKDAAAGETRKEPEELARRNRGEGQQGARTGKVVFVLASKRFWFDDYDPVRRELEKGVVQVVVASTVAGQAIPDPTGRGQPVPVDLLLQDVKAADFDAVIFAGGRGVNEFFAHQPGGKSTRELCNAMLAAGKYVAALCLAPAVLADAGVLKGKRATGFDQGVRATIKAKGGTVVDDAVVEDGLILTARGPFAAQQFAELLLKRIKP
jgi:protease I